MISGYNTGGQPVKVPNFFFILFADFFFFIKKNLSLETRGGRPEIYHYAGFLRGQPHAKVQ